MKEKYEVLDGLRLFSLISIISMHVLLNSKFDFEGFVFKTIIPSFTNYTYLFMMISSFSMCCGYYRHIQENSISIEQFYKRRYQRIWPFFAVLCTFEMLIDHNLNSVYEWIADLTLAFGLIPNNRIKVVGVGWFVGVVFVFYMLFPFFVFLMNNRKRAWYTLIVSAVLHVLCNVRFKGAAGRANIIYSSIFFVAGGIIYLYRNEIRKMAASKWLITVALIVSVLIYYGVNSSELMLLVVFALLLITAIIFDRKNIEKLFNTKIVKFVSSLTMEVYLCHMFVFRLLEKLNLLYLIKVAILDYVVICVMTIVGAFILAFLLRKIVDFTTLYCINRRTE